MDKSRLIKIIRRRLNLEDHDWSIIEKNRFLIIQVIYSPKRIRIGYVPF
jgi:hypothetical protein